MTLIGIFNDRPQANAAVLELENIGYNPKDISVVVKEEIKNHGTKGGSAVSGAVSGATAGTVIGGLTGLLIGIGAIAIPGIGAILVGGPIAIALGLTGAAAATISGAATGLLAGGLVGGLVGLGLPEDVAREYEQKVREGAVLLAVTGSSGDDISTIKNIFGKYNAAQVRVLNTS
jgi:hypothetical protein